MAVTLGQNVKNNNNLHFDRQPPTPHQGMGTSQGMRVRSRRRSARNKLANGDPAEEPEGGQIIVYTLWRRGTVVLQSR